MRLLRGGEESKGISLGQALEASSFGTEGKVGRLGTGQVNSQVWWLTCRDFLCDDFYFPCEEEQS